MDPVLGIAPPLLSSYTRYGAVKDFSPFGIGGLGKFFFEFLYALFHKRLIALFSVRGEFVQNQ